MIGVPHDGVWTRLGRSDIHGVGVIAIRRIPAGTNIFGTDTGDIVWIAATAISALPPEIRRLYEDFAIRRGMQRGCPTNFNMLGIGWYVNQPLHEKDANLEIGDDYAMIAGRDIAEGEELTINYSTFSIEHA